MPRITKQEQYRRHCFLNMLWEEPNLDIFFSLLPIEKQWQLHDYYQPSQNLSEEEFSVHLGMTQIESPKLAQQAGRHFKVIENTFIQASCNYGANPQEIRQAIRNAYSRRSAPGENGEVKISVVANPPDAERIAKAFLLLAEYQWMTKEP